MRVRDHMKMGTLLTSDDHAFAHNLRASNEVWENSYFHHVVTDSAGGTQPWWVLKNAF